MRTHTAVVTLALIAAVLTALLLACLHFLEVFMTLMLGLALIVITRKLVSDFRASTAKHMRRPWQRRIIGYGLVAFWGFALPLIALKYLLFTLDSAYQYVRGRGGSWKGRVQANVSGTP